MRKFSASIVNCEAKSPSGLIERSSNSRGPAAFPGKLGFVGGGLPRYSLTIAAAPGRTEV